MGYADLILMVAIPITSAALIAFFLPRLSRGLLGPAVLLLTMIACVSFTKQLERSDAWGAPGIIVLFVGAVGAVTGLILIIVGAIRASRARQSKSEAAAPAAVKPFRMPGPGLFTPARLYVTAIVVFPVLLFLGLVFFL